MRPTDSRSCKANITFLLLRWLARLTPRKLLEFAPRAVPFAEDWAPTCEPEAWPLSPPAAVILTGDFTSFSSNSFLLSLSSSAPQPSTPPSTPPALFVCKDDAWPAPALPVAMLPALRLEKRRILCAGAPRLLLSGMAPLPCPSSKPLSTEFLF
jgi:hypothetical protein